MKKTLLNCVLFGAVCLCPYLSQSASADIIFTNSQVDDNGTGFGNVLTVLSGEFGIRNRVGVLPCYLGPHGIAEVRLPSLAARERVQLETALGA